MYKASSEKCAVVHLEFSRSTPGSFQGYFRIFPERLYHRVIAMRTVPYIRVLFEMLDSLQQRKLYQVREDAGKLDWKDETYCCRFDSVIQCYESEGTSE